MGSVTKFDIDDWHKKGVTGSSWDSVEDSVTKTNAGLAGWNETESQRGKNEGEVDWGHLVFSECSTWIRSFEGWEAKWKLKEKRGG